MLALGTYDSFRLQARRNPPPRHDTGCSAFMHTTPGVIKGSSRKRGPPWHGVVPEPAGEEGVAWQNGGGYLDEWRAFCLWTKLSDAAATGSQQRVWQWQTDRAVFKRRLVAVMAARLERRVGSVGWAASAAPGGCGGVEHRFLGGRLGGCCLSMGFA